MKLEKDVTFFWKYINDFWQVFEDQAVVEQLWRGFTLCAETMHKNLAQLRASRCIHTVPYTWQSGWERFVFNETTALPRDNYRATADFTVVGVVGEVVDDPDVIVDNNTFDYSVLVVDSKKSYIKISGEFIHGSMFDVRPPSHLPPKNELDYTITASNKYPTFQYGYYLPEGVKDIISLRESPRETTVLPVNTILLDDGTLLLPDLTTRFPGDTVYYPASAYYDEETKAFIFPEGLPVKTVIYVPTTDYVVDAEAGVIFFNKPVYEILWSNDTVRDLSMIADNFGSLIKFYKKDSYTYWREVQGLWYAYWNGATVSNIESGLTIMNNLPVAFKAGIVDDIDLAARKIYVGGDEYTYQEGLDPIVAIGEDVRQFQTLTNAVKIIDEIVAPGWWKRILGTTDNGAGMVFDGQFILDSGRFDSGFFDVPYTDVGQFAQMASANIFLVQIQQSAWFRDMAALTMNKAFLDSIKPAYTGYILASDIFMEDEFDAVDDEDMSTEVHLAPDDIPQDHNSFDEYLHPFFDDGSVFDTPDSDELSVGAFT